MHKLIVVVALAAVLATGCSDSDSGGSSGGSGNASCAQFFGTYDVEGGYMKLNPNCTFFMDVGEQQARGEVTNISDRYISIDIIITKGPGTGGCGTVEMWFDEYGNVTNVAAAEGNCR